MAKTNVELVRDFYAAAGRALGTRPPGGSVMETMKAGDLPPQATEALGYLSPEVQWNPVFSSETYRGRLGIARGWDDLLEAAGNYGLQLREVVEVDEDHVLSVVGTSLEGRSSGIQVDAAVFAINAVRDGAIVRIDEYTDRGEALESVSASR